MRTNLNRIFWVDWAKIIGMFFIIWGHFFPPGMNAFIYSFSVPLFFFVSGYLLPISRRTLKENFVKGWQQLIVPMLFVCLFNLALIVLRNFRHLDVYEHIFTPICHTLLGYSIPLINTMWFVLALFFLKLLLASISFEKRIYWGFVSLIICAIMNLYNIHIQSVICVFWGGCVFMVLGTIICHFKAHISIKTLVTRRCIVVLDIVLILMAVPLANSNGGLYMYKMVWGNSMCLALLLAIVGITVVCTLSHIFLHSPGRSLNFINTGSIFILGYHMNFIIYIKKFIPLACTDLGSFVASLILIVSFIPVIKIVGKYFPCLIGYRNSIKRKTKR